jgi:hypothetical protein
MTPRDIHSFVLLAEHRDAVCLDAPSRYHGEVISGIRLNDPRTDLNLTMRIESLYDTVTLPLSPFYRTDYVIAMAFHLGLRW